ncbi:unnamed protein product [Diatraea saccharalis]|uniref:Peptidase S1 domain-containing protein n=1 Tax=Diatraea saccharalis TaxID=40085 RepID=A0A9N9WK09_9NEOP|nr:unnamed protein product [Diatraea saccharalis]
MVALLHSFSTTGHRQLCGGTIINNRAVLTVAHCSIGDPVFRWQIRAGSTYANSGGIVYTVAAIMSHPEFTFEVRENDVGIYQSTTPIIFTNVIQPASIAGPNYFIGDNEVVWASDWGLLWYNGPQLEELRHVQLRTVNYEVCRDSYTDINPKYIFISPNMLCAGWFGIGGRDQCAGDSGGPVYHNGVVVGITSWGYECAHARFPGVYTRVSNFTSWIVDNA